MVSIKHFCYICSLENGCKFISGFACGHAAGSVGKLSMMNSTTLSIKPIIIACIIIDVLIVKSSLLLFLGVIKSKRWMLCQWLWVIIIGKIVSDAAGMYLGVTKFLLGYISEGVSDIILTIGDFILYAYFALTVRGLINERQRDTEEGKELLGQID